MDSRERVRRALSLQQPDRVPIMDNVWSSTIARWRTEGLPPDVAPADYFGYEMVSFVPDVSPRFPTEVLSEDAGYLVSTTPYGSTVRNRRDMASVPEFVAFPVHTRADWDRIKPRLTPAHDRVEWGNGGAGTGVLGAYQRARAAGKFVTYQAPIGFGHIHQSYIGTLELLLAVAGDPQWVIDMYETNASLVIGMYEVMRAGGLEFDGVFLSCDLGFRSGTFFSRRHFEQQLHPSFARLFGYFRSRGLPVILHSDGRILDYIPYFLEEGLSCLNPLEVKAGMDLVQLKQQYGDRLAFMGGIDVRAMAAADPKVIEQEIATKLSVAKAGGGYIYHSDHSVPDDVSFNQYRRVIDLVMKYGC